MDTQPPTWLEVNGSTVPSDPSLRFLGEGERDAITLAMQHRQEALLLMDEGYGRREASRRNLRISGTLGVLNDAASRGWVDLPTAFQRLQQTTFRASPSLLQSFLDRDAREKADAKTMRSADSFCRFGLLREKPQSLKSGSAPANPVTQSRLPFAKKFREANPSWLAQSEALRC